MNRPMAVAAAQATMETYRQNDIFARADAMAPVWEDALHSLKGLPHVQDLRNLGLVGAIELESRPGAPGARGMDAMKLAWDDGVMIRATGDIIALSPPLIISESEVESLFGKLDAILKILQ